MTNNKHGGVYVDEFLFYLKYERGFSINTIKTYEIYLNEFSSYLKRQRLNLDEIDHFCMKRKCLLAAHFALCALTINIEHQKKEAKEVKKRRFEQEGVDDFFKESANMAEDYLRRKLKEAKTEDEKKRIKKFLEDFKGGNHG